MAWGSPKQIAFFKSMAARYNICGQLEHGSGAGKDAPDVFEYEGKLRAHEARYARAVKQAKAMRDRLAKKRSRRMSDKAARRRGFKDADAQEAAHWRPWQNREKKYKMVKNLDPLAGRDKRKASDEGAYRFGKVK